MIKIDCLGDMCPVPVLRLQHVLPALRAGETCMLITDHSCTLANLDTYCKGNGLSYEAEEVINGVWEITIAASK